MEPKKFYLSKTFWLNAIGLLAQAVPGVASFEAAHPEAVSGLFAAANMVLRFLTKSGISIS